MDATRILHPRLRSVEALNDQAVRRLRFDAKLVGILDVVGRFARRLAFGRPVDERLLGEDRLDRAQPVESTLGGNRLIDERHRLRAFLRAHGADLLVIQCPSSQ